MSNNSARVIPQECYTLFIGCLMGYILAFILDYTFIGF